MRKDVEIKSYFSLFDAGVPKGGEAGNCVDELLKNGSTTAEVVTITETDITGFYQARFIPLDGGDGMYYKLRITHPIYLPQGSCGAWEVLEVDAESLDTALVFLQTDIDFLKNVQGGKWDVVDNQLILYKPDNSTEIARFNLFDKEGNPAMERVYKRERV